MYSLLVTVNFCWLTDDLKPFLESYSRSLAACPGYVDHIWMRDGAEVGIFHLFEDEAALTRFLDSGLLATLTAHPGCMGPAFVRRFRVLEMAGGDASRRERVAVPEETAKSVERVLQST